MVHVIFLSFSFHFAKKNFRHIPVHMTDPAITIESIYFNKKQ